MTGKKKGENQYFVNEHVYMLSPKDVTSHCQGYKLVGQHGAAQHKGHHPADTAQEGSWSSGVIHGPKGSPRGSSLIMTPAKIPSCGQGRLCVQECSSASYANKGAPVPYLKKETVVWSPKYTLSICVAIVQLPSQIRLFVTPWTAACQASLFCTISQSCLRLMSIELVTPSSHLILCPLLFLPSIFPSIRVFSNESALCIRWQSTGASASASVLPMNIQG